MRMMLTITMPTEQGNRAIKDGSLPKLLQAAIDRLKPEAAYFRANGGKRCAMLVFDMKEVADIPPIVEPLFLGLGAEIELVPVMNAEDLGEGLQAAMQAI
jgi:hypothetical protein